jgi:hypothetical protein
MTDFNVGALGTNPIIRPQTLTGTNTSDVFSFTTGDLGNINVAITDISAGDDVDVQLFQDDGDGIFEPTSGDTFVSAGPRPSNLDDSINVGNQPAGTYFAQVSTFGPGSAGDVSYQIGLSSSDPSNLVAIDTQLGNLSGDNVLNGNVNDNDTSDIFSFSLDTFEAVEFVVPPTGGNIDVQLIADSNQNGVIDPGEAILSSTNPGGQPEQIQIDEAGSYLLQAYQVDSGSSINYSLVADYFTTTISSGQVLGNLSEIPIVQSGTLTADNASDVYYFSNQGQDTFGNINISLTDINEGGNANISLYQDDGDGVFEPNADDTFVSTAVRGGNADDSINVADLLRGNYFVEVSQGSDSLGESSYNLSLSNSEPSNLLLNEIPLGNLSSDFNVNANISNSDTSDIFTFSLDFNESVDIDLTPTGGNVDLLLISDLNNNGQVDDAEILASSVSLGTGVENITVDDTGNYFLQAYQVSGDPINYNLNFDYSTAALV